MKQEDSDWIWRAVHAPESLSWAERSLAEAIPEYQRKHMTPLQRQQRAEALRRFRNPPPDVTWVGRDTTDTPVSRRKF